MKSPRPTLLVLCFALAITLTACGPLGPIPGGALRGARANQPPTSWIDYADVEQIQLESRPLDPYSVNTWCGVYAERLYVPTSMILGADDPMERTWVKNVLDDPDVRVRIGDIVYPLRAVRVEDEKELLAVRQVLLAKYEIESDPHVEQGWIFRLEPR
jgi:hypothetical protein